MMRFLFLILSISLLASCRSTKKIQTAIGKKDTTQMVHTSVKDDSTNYIRSAVQQINTNKINFKTFSAKINVGYRDAEEQDYNVTAFVRIYKDSLMWVSVNALGGLFEPMRALITRDSVKILDKQKKTYTIRSIDYLQHVTNLPFTFTTLQDMIVGNAAFLDSNIVSYSRGNNVLSIVCLNNFFKSISTFEESSKQLRSAKVDDVDISSNRTANLLYSDYHNEEGLSFPTKRIITIVSKNGHTDINLDFKQFEIDPQNMSTPFSIPKNYKRS